jgi:hypothetical protein
LGSERVTKNLKTLPKAARSGPKSTSLSETALTDAAGPFIDLLAAPLAPVRTAIDLQEGLELLRDVHMIYDTRRHTV